MKWMWARCNEHSSRVRRPRPGSSAPDREAGVAMMTALFLILVIGMLAILVTGVVIAQITPTMFNKKNSRTIAAAEAGVNAALGQMRSATAADPVNGSTYGNSQALPCQVSGPVDASSPDLTYRVTITYFRNDPRGKDAAWRDANKMICRPETSGQPGVAVTPAYAVIGAEGLDRGVPGLAAESGDRAIETTYQFDVSNLNIEGGNIFSYGTAFCLVADSATADAKIRYQPASECKIDSATNLWSWRTDYRIHLSSSDVAGSPLCLSGRPSSTTATVEAYLAACSTVSKPDPLGQLFRWESGARFMDQNAANTDKGVQCLQSATIADAAKPGYAIKSGDPLLVTPCSDGEAVDWRSFKPDARLGAAAASYATHQLVSAQEFGRCFDVFEDHIYADSNLDADGNKRNYNLLYTCKQDPSGKGEVKWNHKWYYTEPPEDESGTYSGETAGQNIYVLYNDSDSYKACIMSPAEGAGNRLSFEVYTGSNTKLDGNSCSDKRAKWVRKAETNDSMTSWTFVDYTGKRCISIGPKAPKNSYSWSIPVVAECDGSTAQKWNAPAIPRGAAVDAYRESTTG